MLSQPVPQFQPQSQFQPQPQPQPELHSHSFYYPTPDAAFQAIRQGDCHIALAARVQGYGFDTYEGNAPAPDRTTGHGAGHDLGHNAGEGGGQSVGQDVSQNSRQHEGQGTGQSIGQNASQNASQNAGQGASQSAGHNAGQHEGQDAGRSASQSAGHNADNAGQVCGRGWGRGLEAAAQAFLQDGPSLILTAGSPDALAEDLAPAFTPAMRPLLEDALHLARRYCAATGMEAVRFRLERINHDSCRRFHVDHVVLRLLCTYVGPGVQWRQADAGEKAVVHQAQTGAVALLKGGCYPGWQPEGAVQHRSPPLSALAVPTTRLLLTLDAPQACGMSDDQRRIVRG